MVYALTSHNKRLTLRRLAAARVPQNRVRAYTLCAVLLHHILPALVLLRKPYSGWQTVSYQERYVQVCLKWLENN
jgi:hypothetical protein